tara:strand:+ start:351 stop:923 length:573 start_codon:yes stop_codon:yes gene_type:complete
MNKNFTQYAFTPDVKELQTQNGSRKAYERMERSGDRFELGASEIEFIQSRDSFYIATVGENGWPYTQHRGGSKGFLKALDSTTLIFGDYSGNRQYISAGNVISNAKANLFLMDYPTQQRLKIWATVTIRATEDVPDLTRSLQDETNSPPIERVFIIKIQGFDWNCPKYITPRYTLEEIRNTQSILNQLKQ